MVPEAIFDPGLIEKYNGEMGISELLHKSVKECDWEIRKDLY